MNAAELDRRILAAIEGSRASWSLDDDRFQSLALDLFAYQWERLPAYRRFAARRGAVPGRINSWHEIPPIPASIFKNARWATFPPAHTVRRFRSSGTTAIERATLELDTLALYDAALLPPLERYLFPDGARLDWLALLPDPARVADSSLAYMVGQAARSLARSVRYCVDGDTLDLETAIDILERAAAAGRPLAVLGTAFALVHLVDALAARRRRLELPPPSRVMETGGLKGRSRAVTRSELYTALGRQLGLPRHAIVGEYGMTEMISQFYDAGLRDRIDDPESRVLVAPPWVRTSVVDRRTGEPVAPGAAGVLVHLDLGARGSAVRLETEDLGRLAGDGFVLLGRARDAAPRGCSLPYEEIERRIRGGGDRTDERSIARPVDDVTSVDHPEVHATHVHLPPSIELRIGGWDDSPERLAALAEALAAGAAAVRRRHDAAARAAALARLSDAWLAPECAARARALDVLAATSGRARAMLAMALDALFLELRRPGLDRLLASERQALAASPPRLVLHIPAGSVLPPTIVGPLASLLLGAPCIVRPPRSIAILPALWAAALTTLGEGGAASDAAGAAAADLATLIAVVPWERSRTDLTRTALRAAASAVLSGDDATLDAISALAPTTTRIVRHGHRIAVAAIDGRRLARRAATIAAALARDVTLYDQRGCLSPQTVLVVESAPGQAHDLARHLAAQLRRMAVRAPYDVHLVEDGEAFAGALRARELLAAMRGEHLHGGVESGWAVVVQGAGEARVESAPAGRVVFVGAVRRLEEAITLLEPLAPLLQGVGMELDVADRARLATALGTGDVLEATGAACGPIRLCRPGRLQAPPATWAADGLPPLASQLAAPPGRD